jgi:hypothetical protein
MKFVIAACLGVLVLASLPTDSFAQKGRSRAECEKLADQRGIDASHNRAGRAARARFIRECRQGKVG